MKRKTDNFNKFFHKKSNAAIKEEFRQEKKAVKRERKEAIEKHFEEKRKLKYKPDEPEPGQRTARYPPKNAKGKAAQRPERPGKSFKGKAGGRVEMSKPEMSRSEKGKPGKPVSTPFRRPVPVKGPLPVKDAATTPIKSLLSVKQSARDKALLPAKKPAPVKGPLPAKGVSKAPAARGKVDNRPGTKPKTGPDGSAGSANSGKKSSAPAAEATLPLNKYIAHGGICSRRDAADLIRQGKVQVNGKLVSEPGTKVFAEDEVKVNGKKVIISRNFVYILLNKPKDYITTTDDPQGRRTVLDLVRQATTERVYPIGRLDRNTSGVLLLTNDGELAQKLAHPKHEIRKIYHVVLDKSLTKADFDKIVNGVSLEDGVANIDAIAYADSKDKTQIGLEIHSGRNRIVRRIFEHLGYDVKGLDRVMYAGLTKKNVQRGEWRLLSEKEIRLLKYMNSSTR